MIESAYWIVNHDSFVGDSWTITASESGRVTAVAMIRNFILKISNLMRDKMQMIDELHWGDAKMLYRYIAPLTFIRAIGMAFGNGEPQSYMIVFSLTAECRLKDDFVPRGSIALCFIAWGCSASGIERPDAEVGRLCYRTILLDFI